MSHSDIIVTGYIHLGLLLQYLRGANLITSEVRMAKVSLPHHLAALWFADIAGYSARVAEDERGALQLVEILQALSRSYCPIATKVEWLNSSVMLFSPNFQAQKWPCAPQPC